MHFFKIRITYVFSFRCVLGHKNELINKVGWLVGRTGAGGGREIKKGFGMGGSDLLTNTSQVECRFPLMISSSSFDFPTEPICLNTCNKKKSVPLNETNQLPHVVYSVR